MRSRPGGGPVEAWSSASGVPAQPSVFPQAPRPQWGRQTQSPSRNSQALLSGSVGPRSPRMPNHPWVEPHLLKRPGRKQSSASTSLLSEHQLQHQQQQQQQQQYQQQQQQQQQQQLQQLQSCS